MMSMPDSEFMPAMIWQRIRTRWWLPVALAVLGGLIGWAFHFIRTPVYQATATLTVMMDFTRGELTQYEQDYAFNAVGAVVNSSAVMERVVTVAQARSVEIPSAQQGQKFLEGRQSVWDLHVRSQDPDQAADLANIWAEVSLEVLNTALEHSIQADQLTMQIYRLEACLPETPGMAFPLAMLKPSPKDCSRYSLSEIQAELAARTTALAEERSQTMGILSSFEFALSNPAVTPTEPVVGDPGKMTLAGAAIGVIISLWVAGSLRTRRRE
jgi:uncharacterized protein involved in exopolysaccharide biosynthesis